jgi:DNA-binding transcriptional LysR family regulator
MRGHQSTGQDMIEFAVPHSLAFTFFPHWVMELRQRFGAFKSRLVGLNVHDAVMQLTEGSCDLLLAYHHATQPLQLNPERYDMLSLGSETLAPYAKAGADGRPLFSLPGQPQERVPFLAYSSGAYLGRLVDLLLKQAGEPLYLDPIYETDMADGLKAMALEGHGLAFLPGSSVRNELRARRLIPAGPTSNGKSLEVAIEIRLYREKPELARHPKPAALALWDFLAGRTAASADQK